MSTLSAVILAALSVCAQHYVGPTYTALGKDSLSLSCLKDATCWDTFDSTNGSNWPVGYRKCAVIYSTIAMREQKQREIEKAGKRKIREAKLRKEAAGDRPLLDAALAQLRVRAHP